jgi:hypothetical protein
MKEFKINELMVLGDLLLIIEDMVNHGDWGSKALSTILMRTRCIAISLGKDPSSTSNGS